MFSRNLSGGNNTVGEPTLALGFCFFGIVVGCFFTYTLSRIEGVKPPYTVCLFIFGICIALIADELDDNGSEDTLVRSIKQWMDIDPDLMLYTLLPPLLFDEAMKLDAHQVQTCFVPSALLAAPGAAYGAYMQSLVCYYMLDYGWSHLFCFMVGSVLCATDPVSVVGMLKSVSGGSTSTVKLTYLITGESLLNDGTALVLFEAIVSEQYNSSFSIVTYFVKVLFISPLLGFALGLGCVYVLAITRRRLDPEDNIIQVAITISTAYLSFFIAQYTLEVSGILCCCAAGLVIAWRAPALILNPEHMEVVWSTLEWIGNTMIFLVAGLIVGKYSYVIEAKDIGSIFIIYITMMLIRLSMLCICYYPVKHGFIKEYSGKDVLFSAFGGLRGAISLALVLIIEEHLDTVATDDVNNHNRYFPAEDGYRAMFIICGVVFLTIVFNGTFAGAFFTWLYGSRLDSSSVDEIIFHYVEKRIRRKARDFIRHTELLPPFDRKEVRKLCYCYKYIYSKKKAKKDASKVLGTTSNDEEDTYTTDTNELSEGAKMMHDRQIGKVNIEFESSVSGKHEVARAYMKQSYNEDSVAHQHSGGMVIKSEPEKLISDRKLEKYRKREEKEKSGGARSLVSSLAETMGFHGDSSREPSLRGADVPDSPTSVSTSGEDGNIVASKQQSSFLAGIGAIFFGSSSQSDSSIDIDRRYSESVYRTREDGVEVQLNNNLVIKFRQVFHGITKHCYMRQIQGGRIVRGSTVALTLLHASRHGLETCDIGMTDFNVIEEKFAYNLKWKERWQWVLEHVAGESENSWLHQQISRIIASFEGDKVYILTSFLESHNYAQRILAKYLGEKGYVDTPEEGMVISESKVAMRRADRLLKEIDGEVVSFHATEMVARMVLNMANDTVMEFEEEGILSEKNTEIFLQRGYEDISNLSGDHYLHTYQRREAKRLANIAESSKSARPSRIWAWTSSLMTAFARDDQDSESVLTLPTSPQGGGPIKYTKSAFDQDDRRTSISTDDQIRAKIGNDESDDDASDDDVVIKQESMKEEYRHKAIMKTDSEQDLKKEPSRTKDVERWDHGDEIIDANGFVEEEGGASSSGTGSPGKKYTEVYESETDSDVSEVEGGGVSTRSITYNEDGLELSASRRVSDIDAAMRDFEYREEHALDMHSEAKRQSLVALAKKDIDDIEREFEEEQESRKEELELEQEEANRLLERDSSLAESDKGGKKDI
jgi:NhaP-type Na+/H+ or K+/H+ antiporter